MSLETSFERVELPLADPFTISRGTTETVENVVVRVVHEGPDGDTVEGVGAAAPSRYYGETAGTVAAVLPDLLSVVEDVADEVSGGATGDEAVDGSTTDGDSDGPTAAAEVAHLRQRVERRLGETVGRNPAARCAVDIALADLAGKRLGVPCYRQWGLDPAAAPTSSFTIGLADPEEMRTKAEEAVDSGFSVLKVKLGSGRDRERLEAVRAGAPDARIRVDANGAWAPREAVEKTALLAEHDVEFVEQPVPASDVDGLRFVRERGAVPVAADESVTTADTVPRVADAVDVVVAKPMKCGSLREAERVATVAHAHDCEAMIGCMVASNAAMAASCHLAPLFDYADLDGALLLGDDTFEGIPMPGGQIDLDGVDRPGTGAVETGG